MSSNGQVTVTVSTAAQMHALGRALAGLLRAGDLVILSGGLGAGKTTLTQGIGAGLGVRGPVTSPTFVIARVHPPADDADPASGASAAAGGGAAGGAPAARAAGRPSLVHADAYRLGSALELDDLDLETGAAASVTVVEWGEGLAEGLAADRLEITITPEPGNDADAASDQDELPGNGPRTVRITAVGERWEGVQLPLASPADRL